MNSPVVNGPVVNGPMVNSPVINGPECEQSSGERSCGEQSCGERSYTTEICHYKSVVRCLSSFRSLSAWECCEKAVLIGLLSEICFHRFPVRSLSL